MLTDLKTHLTRSFAARLTDDSFPPVDLERRASRQLARQVVQPLHRIQSDPESAVLDLRRDALVAHGLALTRVETLISEQLVENGAGIE